MTNKETIEHIKTQPDNCNYQIIRQLLYYDIFDHPLTKEEIFRNCSPDKSDHEWFEDLINRKLIYKINNYYSPRNDTRLSLRRKKGEEYTQKAMPKALKMASLISKFPFVRAVALSGSISKGYMDSTTDVDFFIITTPKRLWLTRTLLILYKKVFLLNSFRFFCLNYFIDEDNLEIPDRNIFSATEMNTLKPVFGHKLMALFFRSNNWVTEYYKGYSREKTNEDEYVKKMRVKKSLEFLLSNFIGNIIDILSMKLTVQFWRLKYKNDSKNLFTTSFRLNRSVAKYHPGNFQKRVLNSFNKKMDEFRKLETNSQ